MVPLWLALISGSWVIDAGTRHAYYFYRPVREHPYGPAEACLLVLLVLAYRFWRRARPNPHEGLRAIAIHAAAVTAVASVWAPVADLPNLIALHRLVCGATFILIGCLLLEIKLSTSPLAQAVVVRTRREHATARAESEQRRDQPRGGLTEPRA